MSPLLPPLPFSVAPSASKLEEVPEKIPLQDKTEFQEVEVDMQLAGVVHESDDEEDFDLPPEVDVRKKKSKLTEYQVSHSLPSHTNRHTCACASAHTPLLSVANANQYTFTVPSGVTPLSTPSSLAGGHYGPALG